VIAATLIGCPQSISGRIPMSSLTRSGDVFLFEVDFEGIDGRDFGDGELPQPRA